jgi:phenylalanyl-tRNA synthetase beta chain
VGDGDLSVAGIRQPMRVAGLVVGSADPAQWGRKERPADFFDAKGDVEALLAPLQPCFIAASHPALHPGRCAAVWLGDQLVGHVGELHPQWRQVYELPHAPVLFELDLAAVLERPVPAFKQASRQQPVQRDVALVVGEQLSHDALIGTLKADPSALIRSATLFDIYKPAPGTAGFAEGERSLAVRLELLAFNSTLTEEQIQGAVDQAVARAHAAHGARLRG